MLYAAAYSQLQSGELEAALKSAEQGFQQTQSTDPVWNYKFLVIKAEAWAGQGGLECDRVVQIRRQAEVVDGASDRPFEPVRNSVEK